MYIYIFTYLHLFIKTTLPIPPHTSTPHLEVGVILLVLLEGREVCPPARLQLHRAVPPCEELSQLSGSTTRGYSFTGRLLAIFTTTRRSLFIGHFCYT